MTDDLAPAPVADDLGAVGNVFSFVDEWTAAGAVAHRGPKTVFTGERLCQLLDPFGNLFGVRQAPAATSGAAMPAAR